MSEFIKIKKDTIKKIFYFSIFILILIWFFYPTNNSQESFDDKNTDVKDNILNEKFSNIDELHWTHMPLTYTIKDNANCGYLQINKMLEAFEILENETSYLEFVESNSSDADLIIQCVDVEEIQNSYFEEIDRLKRDKLNCIERAYNYKKDSISTYTEGILNKSEQMFINASKEYLNQNTLWTICYINVSDISYENIKSYGIEDWQDISNSVLGDARPIIEGNVIKQGKINLYKPENGWSVCTDFPAKEMHELLHLFGFDHVAEPYWDPYYGYVDWEPAKDIMFPHIYCTYQKEVQQRYLSCLDYIYSEGKVGFCSKDINFISSYAECPYDWYPTIDNEYCCPEPNMRIVAGYCDY